MSGRADRDARTQKPDPEKLDRQTPTGVVAAAAGDVAESAARSTGDRRMEQVIGRLLQVGVTLASAVVLLGGVLYLRAHAGETVSYTNFQSDRPELRHARDVLQASAHGDAAALIQVGVLLLIATPVARVVFAAVSFATERDRLYLVISLAVLLVLLVALFHGP